MGGGEGDHHTAFVSERSSPEERLNLSNSGFVSEEGHSGCIEEKCSLPNMV